MVDYKFGEGSLKHMEGLDDMSVKVLKLALLESSIDFSVISGYRTETEQHKLFMQGLSEADGYKIKSQHQFGLAWDVVPYVPGVDVWDTSDPLAAKAWLEVGRSMMRAARLSGVVLEWGITYNFGTEHDYPHFQINTQ